MTDFLFSGRLPDGNKITITLPSGASAKSIAARLCGAGEQEGNYPHDAGDFARCGAFLIRHPEVQAHFHLMADVNAYWAALVPEWAALWQMSDSDRTERLVSILHPIEAADPDHLCVGSGLSLRTTRVSFKGRPEVEVPNDQLGAVLKAELAAAFQSKRKPKDRTPMKDDPDFRKHNQQAYNVTADELRQFIERYEQLEAEKKDIADQQKDVMAVAKGRGYDTKVIRKVIALRKRKPDDIAEEEAVLEMYKAALGMA